MTKIKPLLLLLFSAIPFITFSQNMKGMYVNDFKNIIGDTAKENELLTFAQEHSFDYLLLYNLYYIHTNIFDLTDPIESLPLTNFIEKAKTQFGILEVGAVGEKYQSFDKVIAFNANNAADEVKQFDVLHIEFEYWNSRLINSYYCSTYLQGNGYSCDVPGAFDFFIDQMALTKSTTDELGLKTEAYIGLLKPEQGPFIHQVSDRLMVHYYRKSDVYNNGNSIYNYKKDRLGMLAPVTGSIAIVPVFSSRSYFMGPWLTEHQMDQAFDTYMNGQNGFLEEDADWVDHIDIQGHHWYRYTDLKINAIPPAQGMQVGSGGIQIDGQERSNDNLEKAAFQFYPSPASHSLTINSNTLAQVKLFSSNGDLVQNTRLDADEYKSLSLHNMTTGLYILQVQLADKIEVHKVQIVK